MATAPLALSRKSPLNQKDYFKLYELFREDRKAFGTTPRFHRKSTIRFPCAPKLEHISAFSVLAAVWSLGGGLVVTRHNGWSTLAQCIVGAHYKATIADAVHLQGWYYTKLLDFESFLADQRTDGDVKESVRPRIARKPRASVSVSSWPIPKRSIDETVDHVVETITLEEEQKRRRRSEIVLPKETEPSSPSTDEEDDELFHKMIMCLTDKSVVSFTRQASAKPRTRTRPWTPYMSKFRVTPTNSSSGTVALVPIRSSTQWPNANSASPITSDGTLTALPLNSLIRPDLPIATAADVRTEAIAARPFSPWSACRFNTPSSDLDRDSLYLAPSAIPEVFPQTNQLQPVASTELPYYLTASPISPTSPRLQEILADLYDSGPVDTATQPIVEQSAGEPMRGMVLDPTLPVLDVSPSNFVAFQEDYCPQGDAVSVPVTNDYDWDAWLNAVSDMP